MLSLSLKSKSDGPLSKLISINYTKMNPEIYFDNGDYELEDLALKIDAKSESPSTISLSQNTPNPFIDQTNIMVYSQCKGVATFEIFNLTGQSIMSKHVNIEHGLNSILVDRSSVVSEGVYLYRISMDNISENKLMVVSN